MFSASLPFLTRVPQWQSLEPGAMGSLKRRTFSFPVLKATGHWCKVGQKFNGSFHDTRREPGRESHYSRDSSCTQGRSIFMLSTSWYEFILLEQHYRDLWGQACYIRVISKYFISKEAHGYVNGWTSDSCNTEAGAIAASHGGIRKSLRRNVHSWLPWLHTHGRSWFCRPKPEAATVYWELMTTPSLSFHFPPPLHLPLPLFFLSLLTLL